MTAPRFWQIASISAALIFAFYVLRPHTEQTYPATDFGIFYCAGSVANAGANPYLVEPLRTCEHRVWPSDYLLGYAEPSPLPGYDLVPFALLALVPFSAAKLIWLAFCGLAFGISVAAGARLSRLNPVAVFALLIVPVAILSIRIGQLGPFIAAALLSAVMLLREGKERAAALALLGCAIEPHVALPALIGCFALVPRTRTILAAGTAMLAAMHFAMLGGTTGITYFTQLLPSMARAESSAADQYGSIWFIHQIGVSSEYATRAAQALFIAAIIAGILLARSLIIATGDRAYAVALPVALSVILSPYLHDVQLCSALVMPLAALGTWPGRNVWVATALMLAVPWYGGVHSTVVAIEGSIGAALFVALSVHRNRVAGGGAGAITLIATLAIIMAIRHLPLHVDVAQYPPYLAHPVFAADSWAAHLFATPLLQARGLQVAVPKMFAWAACACIAAASALSVQQATIKHVKVPAAN